MGSRNLPMGVRPHPQASPKSAEGGGSVAVTLRLSFGDSPRVSASGANLSVIAQLGGPATYVSLASLSPRTSDGGRAHGTGDRSVPAHLSLLRACIPGDSANACEDDPNPVLTRSIDGSKTQRNGYQPQLQLSTK